MNSSKSQFNFLLILLGGVFILSFFIFRPFLYALVLALVFAVIFQPMHEWLLTRTKGRGGISALAATLVIVSLIFIPLAFLSTQIFKEVTHLYSYFANGEGQQIVMNNVNGFADAAQKYLPDAQDFSAHIASYLKTGLSWLIAHLGSIFSNVTQILVSSFIFLLSLYYLLKDGKKLKKAIVELSPLSDFRDEAIFVRLEKTINSVVRGNLLIALIQGSLSAVGFAIFGVPSPVLLGCITAIAALIPAVGSALVIFPSILFLFFTGETFSAIGLTAWGVVAVGLIDNFLGPKLVGMKIRIHSFIILLSVLGGIAFFGPIGFLLGPLIISLLFALIESYFSIFREKKVK